MAFRDFMFPEVGEQLGLTIRDGDLFPNPPALAVRPDFLPIVMEGVELATAFDTEKARSEYVIAPILFELWRMTRKRFRLFSGAEFTVDASIGLNGSCDFMLTWGPSQHYVSAPFAAVIEAKRFDYRSGFGQCIAAMRAAAIANERAKTPLTVIHGAVTYGTGWKFLQLQDRVVTIDAGEFLLPDIAHILGVLDLITRVPAALAA